MDELLDQRHMTGETLAVSPGDVRSRWEALLAKRGMRPKTSNTVVTAYISEGRWVADCPNYPRCRGGIACWDQNPHGCCLDCGTVVKVKFPTKRDRDKAAAALLARPDPKTRNWRPEFEKPADLVRENAEHL